jgi:uncharacterized cupredoxin-like copper-binding protein
MMRTGTFTRVLAVATFAAVIAACGGGGDSEATYKEPAGPATETINIQSGNVYFKPNQIDAKPGIAEVKLKNVESGTHDLVVQGLPGFQLEVSGEGSTAASKLALKTGKYEFYCTIPGHKEAGMKGTITVAKS